MDWYVEIEDNSDAALHYSKDDINTELRTGILDGRHRMDSTVVMHSKAKNDKWNKTTSSLFEFAKGHFLLRILYQPVWGYAMAGFKWGFLVGAIIKLMDTLFFLGLVNPTHAIMLLLAIGVCFIPRIGIIAAVAVCGIMLTFTDTNINFFLLLQGSAASQAFSPLST